MTAPRILLWGTPDFGKPRTRILIESLRRQELIIDECTIDLWVGVEDKSQLKGAPAVMRRMFAFLCAYPLLIWRYCRAPKHDAVFVAYMGHFDVLALWPFAKLRGAQIVWDAFLSLYDTAIEDRKLAPRNSLVAALIRFLEARACACADLILLDTKAHADYFKDEYRLPPSRVMSVWVGVEQAAFPAVDYAPRVKGAPFQVLFYGQFIPLHGIEHIVEAARLIDDREIRWTIIGRGQERAQIESRIDDNLAEKIQLIDWVAYDRLGEAIAQADLCLGVFGAGDKTARVIPNKVFQILAVGRPIITADTPAIRELLRPEMDGVWLVRQGCAVAIAKAVVEAKAWARARQAPGRLYPGLADRLSADAVVKPLIEKLAAIGPAGVNHKQRYSCKSESAAISPHAK